MTAPFSPLLRVLGDRAGMLLAPSAFDRINMPNSREAPVGTGAFTYVDEDLDGPYAQQFFPEYWQDGAPRVERLTSSQSIEPTQQVNGLLTGEFDMNIPGTAITGAEFIQANLAQYGISLNIVVKPAPDYYLEFFEKRVNTFMSGMSVRADPWQQLAFLDRADGPYDFMLPPGDRDAELQAAFQKVTEIFDPEPRAEAFRELNRVMVSRAWHIHTHYWSSVYAHDPALEFEHFGDGKPHFRQKDVGWAT